MYNLQMLKSLYVNQKILLQDCIDRHHKVLITTPICCWGELELSALFCDL